MKATIKTEDSFSFGSYVCDGDTSTVERDGYIVTATVVRYGGAGAPWENEDGHGPVSRWTSRPKRPGERVLNADRGSYRYYDFAEAMKIAKRDSWGPGTPAEAAELDFQALHAWCSDEWWYCGIVLSVAYNGHLITDNAAALWGVECNYNGRGGTNEYLATVADELLSEALTYAEKLRAEIIEELSRPAS